jgi:hypothetical protein
VTAMTPSSPGCYWLTPKPDRDVDTYLTTDAITSTAPQPFAWTAGA